MRGVSFSAPLKMELLHTLDNSTTLDRLIGYDTLTLETMLWWLGLQPIPSGLQTSPQAYKESLAAAILGKVQQG